MHATVVHRFMVGDVEDPEIYIAEPVIEWQHSEQGEWVMQHSVETPLWRRSPSYHAYGYGYEIVAFFNDADLVFWKLKYE